MAKSATLVLRAPGITEAQEAGGAGEDQAGEEKQMRRVDGSGGRFCYLRSHTMSYFVLSKRNIIQEYI